MPEDGVMCGSCGGTILGEGLVGKHGDFTVWAHAECAHTEAEHVRQAQRDVVQAPTQPDQARRFALASKAPARVFRARHNPLGVDPETGQGRGDPACELCCEPIRVGELARRKRPKSSKRMHDACVLAVLRDPTCDPKEVRRAAAASA